ncbi:MAG: hypothetical protein JW795_00260 [Chitinivibrionales bacterium]|nr:hypothetical protein [Chitinivibrionales bacterium]
MSHTFEELKKKTVAQLREIAATIEHEAVKGYTQLNKEHLLKALCTALSIEMHAHHEVVGVDKKSLKKRIQELKQKRQEVLQAKDHTKLKILRRKIHSLKRLIHKAEA